MSGLFAALFSLFLQGINSVLLTYISCFFGSAFCIAEGHLFPGRMCNGAYVYIHLYTCMDRCINIYTYTYMIVFVHMYQYV